MAIRFLILATAALVQIWAWTASSSNAQDGPLTEQDAIALDKLGSRPLDRNADDKLGEAIGQVIGPPLSHAAHVCYPRGEGLPGPAHQDNHLTRPKCWVIDEYQTLREALWHREAQTTLNHLPHETIDGLVVGDPAQRMAFTHLEAGKPLRRGDSDALHGALLDGYSPNTYGMAKKWQRLMRCVGISARRDPACTAPGS